MSEPDCNTGRAGLGDSILEQLSQPVCRLNPGQSGFSILNTGSQGFERRVELIEAAERSIDAQYYIWNSDVSGIYLARRLVVAADRGVQLRLLLDDVNVDERDSLLAALDSHPNIHIRIYNPSAVRGGIGKWLAFASDFRRLNRRMHNKTFVVDDAFGIAGGRNIGDEYFDLHPAMNHRDRDVLAAGPIVGDLTKNFETCWNSTWSCPISNIAKKPKDAESILVGARTKAADISGLIRGTVQDIETACRKIEQVIESLIWAPAELVFDSPLQDVNKTSEQPNNTAQVLRDLVQQANSEILVESAYLNLGDRQLELMSDLNARKVKVAALTNSLATNDLITNHAGYARCRPEILSQGVELFEIRPDAEACKFWVESAQHGNHGSMSLHAKSVVIDRRTLFVGSFNINLRSIYLNGETALIIRSPELAERVADEIHLAMSKANSWQVTREPNGKLQWVSSDGVLCTHEPSVNWWRRLQSRFISLMPIEKFL